MEDQENTNEIAVVETFFKTNNLTMNPYLIQAIVLQGQNIIVKYGYTGEMELKAPAEKGEVGKPLELEVYTARWADAVLKRDEYELLKDRARQEMFAQTNPDFNTPQVAQDS